MLPSSFSLSLSFFLSVSQLHIMIFSNKSAERISPARRKSGGRKGKGREASERARARGRWTVSPWINDFNPRQRLSTTYPSLSFSLSRSHVLVDFLKARRLARGYNSRRFGPRSTAGTDVRAEYDFRSPRDARPESEHRTAAAKRGKERRGGQTRAREDEPRHAATGAGLYGWEERAPAQSCGVCNLAGGM